MPTTRIVILGGGFGGVYAARALEHLLKPSEAEICLVNRENYFVFQPLLPEVVSGSIGLFDTVSPIRRLCPRTQLYVREVERIDLARRVVTLAPGIRPRSLDLPCDYLVIAAGTVTDFSGMPGLAEHALPFRTLGDAVRLRNLLLQSLEEASIEADAEFRKRLLTFVVGGGGFSGVEVLAEMNDFLRSAARNFPTIRRDEVRCVLVHSRDRILPEITPGLAAYAQKILAKRGVTFKLNARITSATADTVVLNTGESIGARTLVCTVPSGPSPLMAALDCEKAKGRLAVDASLALKGHEGRVWALGDCAHIVMAGGETAPPTAQHATREAQTVAENIVASIRGGSTKEFDFGGLGKLGSLGHHSAVAEVFGIKFSGIIAWFLWRAIYLMKMPGLDRKLRVALDWTSELIFPTELVQLRVQPSDNITSEHFNTGDAIITQGDVGDRMYVIQSGEVEVIRDGVTVAALAAGDYFGEMALLTKSPRNSTVRATTPVDVLAVSKSDFSKLLANFGELGSEINRVAAARGK